MISFTPIISTSTGPIFTKYAGLVERWRQMNDLTLFFLSIPRGTLPWQPIFWTKSTSIPHIVVRTTFARAAPPAYDKKGSCYAGHRQTNYLMQWTQANQLTDNNKLTGGEVDMHMKSEVIFLQSICRWATDRLCLASSYSVAGGGLKSSLATISYDQRE